MERCGLAFKVKDGKKGLFRRLLGEGWDEITDLLDKNGLTNFSLWSAENLVFGYYEKKREGEFSATDKQRVQTLAEQMEQAGEWISRPGETMRLMYHNYGIVRENKELIRVRMFMTRLHEGCADEYKARHDVLVEKRGSVVDPGPDSNFSIFSAGDYIFGYDEIDTTMEREETAEEHEGTIAWETRQLGIMDWITNDVDWMTGEVHADCVRIAHHN